MNLTDEKIGDLISGIFSITRIQITALHRDQIKDYIRNFLEAEMGSSTSKLKVGTKVLLKGEWLDYRQESKLFVDSKQGSKVTLVNEAGHRLRGYFDEKELIIDN